MKGVHVIGGLFFAIACLMVLSSGCGQASAGGPPDVEMTSSATGFWIGQTNSDVSLDIQSGGFIKITRSGQESIGSWKEESPGLISAVFNSQSYSMPFERKDLSLKITLPGESAMSEFTQM